MMRTWSLQDDQRIAMRIDVDPSDWHSCEGRTDEIERMSQCSGKDGFEYAHRSSIPSKQAEEFAELLNAGHEAA